MSVLLWAFVVEVVALFIGLVLVLVIVKAMRRKG